MSRSLLRRYSPTVLLAFVALAVVGGLAHASDLGQSASTIPACYNTSTGALRLVNGVSCSNRTEKSITWNQEGPQGAIGPQGPVGPTGPPGKPGPAKHWVAPVVGASGASFVFVFNPTQFNALIEVQFCRYRLNLHKVRCKVKCPSLSYGPGRVTPVCAYSGTDPHKTAGFAYVVSDRGVLPYGWSGTICCNGPPPKGGAAALGTAGGGTPFDWYPLCPRVFPGCKGVED